MTFPSAVVSVFENGNTRLWQSTDLLPILNNISKVSENITHDHLSVFKFKILSSLHTFVQLKCM
jgi:hypothetical protein